jgi:virginiamycin B lyase
MSRVLLSLVALAIALPAIAESGKAVAEKTEQVQIREWPVPWKDTRPRDPFYAGPDAVWFVGQTGNYLGRFNPQTAEFTKIDLVDEPGPHNVIVGRNGLVWYAGNRRGYIGRYDPQTRRIARIPMPYAAAEDPHTLAFEAGERNIWFTVQAGNIIGRLRLVNEIVDLTALNTPDARPYGIAMSPSGPPWVALFGTNKLATVDPRTFELTEHTLPRAGARPRRLGFTSDGKLWYGDFAEGYLGVFTPETRSVKEWLLPGGKDSRPYALAVDAKDRIWVVETGSQPNRLVGFDPKSERFFSSTPIPSGGGAIRNMHYAASTGQIWFGTDTNTIGYAQVN